MFNYDAPTETIQADLDYIKQLTGEERISLRKANWSQLMKQGVIATVTVGRWRGRTRLDPEDLGLPPDAILEQDLSDLLHLGDKILLPAPTLRALEAVESRARKTLINPASRPPGAPSSRSLPTVSSGRRWMCAETTTSPCVTRSCATTKPSAPTCAPPTVPPASSPTSVCAP